MRVKIGGKYWNLVFERNPMLEGNPVDGYCTPPGIAGKKIVIRQSVRKNPERFLCVLIHEILHAHAWSLDEQCVTDYAEDAARIAIKLGFALDKCQEG